MIREADIGGATVRRLFTFGDKKLMSGAALTRDEVLSIRPANRRSLIDRGVIEVYPKAKLNEQPGIRMIVKGEKKGEFDVILGRKINEAPLSMEEAEAMVASPN